MNKYEPVVGYYDTIAEYNGRALTRLGWCKIKVANNNSSSNNNNKYTTSGGKCGRDNGLKCPNNQCCSKYGFCGVKDAHCKSGCQSSYGKCK